MSYSWECGSVGVDNRARLVKVPVLLLGKVEDPVLIGVEEAVLVKLGGGILQIGNQLLILRLIDGVGRSGKESKSGSNKDGLGEKHFEDC